MYAYCIYAAMSQKSKQLPNGIKRAETSIDLIVCWYHSAKSGLIILLLILTVAQRESGTSRTISW